MDEARPVSEDLVARVARLESQVAELQRRLGATPPRLEVPEIPKAPIPPAPPRPLAPPIPVVKPPKPVSPVVLVAGAGAIIFLLGALFFLHWSIQQGWIGPEIRFLMGLAGGAGLTLLAARFLLGDRPALGVAVLLAGVGTLMFTLRFGAFSYHFYPPALGFGGTFAAVLLSGALGARARRGGALFVALAAGLAAPLVFSEKPHREVELAVYLAVLQGGALLVPYLARLGARWGGCRWLLVLVTWLYLLGACLEVQPGKAEALALMLLLHLGISFLWIWLPAYRGDERPCTPTVLWILVSLGFTGLGAILWRHKLQLMPEAFAIPVLGMAGLNLALVAPLRRRMDGCGADLGLLALAFGHLALAVPIALAWRWVGPLWGCFALAMAWASLRRQEMEEGTSLVMLAWGLTLAASVRWLVSLGLGVYFVSQVRVPFLNEVFACGALTAAAWALLSKVGGPLRGLAFAGMQLVGGLTLSCEVSVLVLWWGGSPSMSRVMVTLVWAFLGAAQWLRSLSAEKGRLAFAVAGYSWLALASFKLMVVDLASADAPKRALAFLGVGVVFLGAALVGNRVRRSLAPEEDA